MKKSNRIGLFLLLVSLFFTSCKDEFTQKPLISLKKSYPYVFRDTNVHINSDVLVGIGAKAVGEENNISRFKMNKDTITIIDTLINKPSVFLKCSLLIDSYDTTLYYFSAYDDAYNNNEFYIQSFRVLDTLYAYDTIKKDTSYINEDLQTIDTSFIERIDTLMDKIDTLVKIDLKDYVN